VSVCVEDAVGFEIEVFEEFVGAFHALLDVGVVCFECFVEMFAEFEAGVER